MIPCLILLIVICYWVGGLITSLKLYHEGYPENLAVVGGWVWPYVLYYRCIRRSWLGVHFKALRKRLQVEDRTYRVRALQSDEKFE